MRKKRMPLMLTMLLLSLIVPSAASSQAKREFRGAWIQCVNGQFLGMSTERMQQTLANQLDVLKADGCNAIIFQVRPECDALYDSKLEPWSRFLTGRQGQRPEPYWDPLRWMVAECHKRGMELHAWINPYRAKTKTTRELSPSHITMRHPERVFPYDGQMILNPALSENRQYICDVVRDIVSRYDIDGLHMDDYFYPYPAAGQSIPDAADYRRDNNGINNIADWRRYNVSMFVKEVSDVIHRTKPWVKFGISPFGIYRSIASDPQNGSRTKGLQNYDDLYADVLLWVNNGWIDYCVPQLYWQIGHPTADYAELIAWWSRYCSKRPLFIGEDIERTAKYPDPNNPNQNQMAPKMALHRKMRNVHGTVLWYAKAAVDNIGNYGKMLREVYWKTPALQPRMTFISSKTPGKVKKVKAMDIDGKKVLFWTAPKASSWETTPTRYVVYAFDKGQRVDTENPANIMAITSDTFIDLPEYTSKCKKVYVVTALNRIDNESKAVKKKVSFK